MRSCLALAVVPPDQRGPPPGPEGVGNQERRVGESLRWAAPWPPGAFSFEMQDIQNLLFYIVEAFFFNCFTILCPFQVYNTVIQLHTHTHAHTHQSRQHIKKQRHYFANKGPSSQG